MQSRRIPILCMFLVILAVTSASFRAIQPTSLHTTNPISSTDDPVPPANFIDFAMILREETAFESFRGTYANFASDPPTSPEDSFWYVLKVTQHGAETPSRYQQFSCSILNPATMDIISASNAIPEFKQDESGSFWYVQSLPIQMSLVPLSDIQFLVVQCELKRDASALPIPVRINFDFYTSTNSQNSHSASNTNTDDSDRREAHVLTHIGEYSPEPGPTVPEYTQHVLQFTTLDPTRYLGASLYPFITISPKPVQKHRIYLNWSLLLDISDPFNPLHQYVERVNAISLSTHQLFWFAPNITQFATPFNCVINDLLVEASFSNQVHARVNNNLNLDPATALSTHLVLSLTPAQIRTFISPDRQSKYASISCFHHAPLIYSTEIIDKDLSELAIQVSYLQDISSTHQQQQQQQQQQQLQQQRLQPQDTTPTFQIISSNIVKSSHNPNPVDSAPFLVQLPRVLNTPLSTSSLSTQIPLYVTTIPRSSYSAKAQYLPALLGSFSWIRDHGWYSQSDFPSLSPQSLTARTARSHTTYLRDTAESRDSFSILCPTIVAVDDLAQMYVVLRRSVAEISIYHAALTFISSPVEGVCLKNTPCVTQEFFIPDDFWTIPSQETTSKNAIVGKTFDPNAVYITFSATGVHFDETMPYATQCRIVYNQHIREDIRPDLISNGRTELTKDIHLTATTTTNPNAPTQPITTTLVRNTVSTIRDRNSGVPETMSMSTLFPSFRIISPIPIYRVSIAITGIYTFPITTSISLDCIEQGSLKVVPCTAQELTVSANLVTFSVTSTSAQTIGQISLSLGSSSFNTANQDTSDNTQQQQLQVTLPQQYVKSTTYKTSPEFPITSFSSTINSKYLHFMLTGENDKIYHSSVRIIDGVEKLPPTSLGYLPWSITDSSQDSDIKRSLFYYILVGSIVAAIVFALILIALAFIKRKSDRRTYFSILKEWIGNRMEACCRKKQEEQGLLYQSYY